MENEAAKSKRQPADDLPSGGKTVPMSAGLKPGQRRSPDADQKKLRRRMNNGQTKTAMSEPDLLRAIAASKSEGERNRLASQLDQVRAQRRAEVEQSRSLDWGSTLAVQTVPTVNLARTRSSSMSDWLADIDVPEHDTRQIEASARAEAVVWSGSRTPELLADAEEYTAQAHGSAQRFAGQFGPQFEVAYQAFLQEAVHQGSRKNAAIRLAADAVVKCPDCKGAGTTGNGMCRTCDGQGKVEQSVLDAMMYSGSTVLAFEPYDEGQYDHNLEQFCTACQGTGSAAGVRGTPPPCPECGGSGMAADQNRDTRQGSVVLAEDHPNEVQNPIMWDGGKGPSDTVQTEPFQGDASSLPVGVEDEETFDDAIFMPEGPEAGPTTTDMAPSLTEGTQPEGEQPNPPVANPWVPETPKQESPPPSFQSALHQADNGTSDLRAYDHAMSKFKEAHGRDADLNDDNDMAEVNTHVEYFRKQDYRGASLHEGKYKYIQRRGDKWVILQKGTGKTLSHHDSEDDAKAAFRAMMRSKHSSTLHSAALLDDIMAWEGGEMSQEDEVRFFQSLIDSGMAWQLQGMYGRNAQALIDAGLCHPAGGSTTSAQRFAWGVDQTTPTPGPQPPMMPSGTTPGSMPTSMPTPMNTGNSTVPASTSDDIAAEQALLQRARTPAGGNTMTSVQRVVAMIRQADEGMKCAICGASIERDPEGEENRTWHHSDGASHDHEAKPSESKESAWTHHDLASKPTLRERMHGDQSGGDRPPLRPGTNHLTEPWQNEGPGGNEHSMIHMPSAPHTEYHGPGEREWYEDKGHTPGDTKPHPLDRGPDTDREHIQFHPGIPGYKAKTSRLVALIRSAARGPEEPDWLRERTNDPYGTPNKVPGPGPRDPDNPYANLVDNPFWASVKYEDIGPYRIFEKDGLWFVYDRQHNAWRKGTDEATARAEVTKPALDVWATVRQAGDKPPWLDKDKKKDDTSTDSADTDGDGEAEEQNPTPQTINCVNCQQPINQMPDGTWVHTASGQAPCAQQQANTQQPQAPVNPNQPTQPPVTSGRQGGGTPFGRRSAAVGPLDRSLIFTLLLHHWPAFGQAPVEASMSLTTACYDAWVAAEAAGATDLEAFVTKWLDGREITSSRTAIERTPAGSGWDALKPGDRIRVGFEEFAHDGTFVRLEPNSNSDFYGDAPVVVYKRDGSDGETRFVPSGRESPRPARG